MINYSSEKLCLDAATQVLLYLHFNPDVVDSSFMLKLFDLMHELQLKLVAYEHE